MPENYKEFIKASKYLPLKIGYISEEHKEKAKDEINETDETRDQGIEALRHSILEKGELSCPLENAYLLQYLRARKFEVERAYKLLHNFYRTKKDHPECYTTFDYKKLGNFAKAGYFLPYRSPEGCPVLVLEFQKWNMEENDVADVFSMLAILLLFAAEDPATQVCGMKAIVNFKGATLRQIKSFTPRYILLLSKALKNCMPCRFKSIHVINESIIFQYLWSILKLFLSDKIKQRFHFHGTNLKQMFKSIPQDILTEELGGFNKFFKPEEFTTKMLAEMEPILDVLLKSELLTD